MSVRVRFAPSPTGQVHIGNIRTAIFNWLFARHNNGKFLLRIEDTDRERSTPEAVQTVLNSLDWLGMNHDEEPLYQSSRTSAHLAAAETLLSKGLAYKEDKGNTGKGECIILRAPSKDVSFVDEVKGPLTKKAGDIQDMVIVRSDGTPVFHLANVVDDIEMNITHIIRGDDHVENTYKHIPLFEALGAAPPRYAHLPMIINQHGKPYSKRDGAAFIGEFKEQGYLADALFNYLALLGWSPGDDREKMDRKDMIEAFTLDRIKSGPAQMDLRKLTHINQLYVEQMPLNDFMSSVKQTLSSEPWFTSADDTYRRAVASLMQSRTHLFTYARDWKYFFSDELQYDEKSVKKLLAKPGVADHLNALIQALEGDGFTEESVESALRSVEKKYDIKEGKLNQPVRVAITGTQLGAGIYETMVLLGKEKCLNRIRYAAAELSVNREQV